MTTNLRAAERSDARFLCQLLNEPTVTTGWGTSGVPISIHKVESDLEGWIEVERTTNRPACLIVETLEAVPVGVLLVDVSSRFNQSMATLSIAITTDAQLLGYGKDSLGALIDALFFEWGIHRLQVLCEADNAAAIKLYDSLSFKREATRKRGTYSSGKFQDQHVFGLLSTDPRPDLP